MARIHINAERKYQRIRGFGASLTDSSAYLLNTILDSKTRETVMRALFDPEEGIGLSVLRNPMGASDYARTLYTYDDMPQGASDERLERFSIAHDLESIIPLTKSAMSINPRLMLITSPWSAPAWMKTSQSLKGGSLKPHWHKAYAMYFVKFIEEYRGRGIDVDAVTVQNEPLHTSRRYPTMHMAARQEAGFVRSYLRPAFQNASIGTKILGYDHNWDRPDYPEELIDRGAECFDGIAWHWYAGNPRAQSDMILKHPGIDMYVTEASGGSWIQEYEPAFSHLMRMCISSLRNGAKAFVLWNIALDQKNGPTVPGFGSSTCRGLVRIDTVRQRAAFTLDYYALAHFSKYVRAGAELVESSQTLLIKSAAFRNANGSVVCVLFNDSEIPSNVCVTIDGLPVAATIALSGHGACTLVCNDVLPCNEQ